MTFSSRLCRHIPISGEPGIFRTMAATVRLVDVPFLSWDLGRHLLDVEGNLRFRA